MKSCRVCGQTKPLADFYPRPGSQDGFRGECKECTKARSAKSAASNPERRKAYMQRYAEEHREYLNAQASKRAKANNRKYYFRRYRLEHYQTVTGNERRWRSRHRAHEAFRRHQRRALGMDTQARDYIAILYSDLCAYCGQPATTIDHITPVAKGGTNAWDNLTAACKSCNSSKHDRSLLTFLMERCNA